MAATLISPQDLINRKDARDIADLVSDSGAPVAESAVLNHPKVHVALEDAEGEVISFLAAFGRYTLESLDALTGPTREFLKRVIAEIAIINLIVRRPSLNPEQFDAYEKIRTNWLKRLQSGEMMLATDDTSQDAARASIGGATLGEYSAMNLIRDRSKYFPARVLPDGRNY